MTIADLWTEHFQEVMADVIKEAELHSLSRVCFVAEDRTEELLERDEVLDAVDSDDDEYFKATQLPTEVEEALVKEEELLEEIPLPGFPTHELERKKKWLKMSLNIQFINKNHHINIHIKSHQCHKAHIIRETM